MIKFFPPLLQNKQKITEYKQIFSAIKISLLETGYNTMKTLRNADIPLFFKSFYFL